MVLGELCALGFLAAGCQDGAGLSAPPGWEVAYRADFKDPAATDAWVKLNAVVKIENGVLVVSPDEDGAAQIILKKPRVPGSVRMEVIGALIGETVSDLSPIINGDETGYSSGYLLQFGGFANAESRLQARGGVVESTINEKVLVTPGKKHHVVAENDSGKIRLLVDGRTVFTYTDSDPLKGAGHGQVGFYVYGCTMKLDKLVVYTKTSEAAGK